MREAQKIKAIGIKGRVCAQLKDSKKP